MHCITTLYDENFVDPNNDATVLPYMEVGGVACASSSDAHHGAIQHTYTWS